METHIRGEAALPSRCALCPVACGANRAAGETGACGAAAPKIAKYYLHPFEEPCISFRKGSGTVFFCGCNLRCAFCQNYEVSRAKRGKEVTPAALANIFRELEDAGADNISLVTPSHVIPYLVAAFELYQPKIPVVYNSGGYDSVEALRLIDEYVDIYLPDMKFVSPALSERYTGRADYFARASEAISFMAKKPLRMSEEGKMLSGLIVRHLVMPLGVNDSVAVLRWFKREMPETAYLSLMSQYTPFGDLEGFPELKRPVTGAGIRPGAGRSVCAGHRKAVCAKALLLGRKIHSVLGLLIGRRAEKSDRKTSRAPRRATFCGTRRISAARSPA